MNICTETFLGVITNHLADLRRMGGYRSGAMANHRASPMIVGIGGCGISVVQAFQRDFPESLENTQSLLLDVEADTGRPFVVGGKIHSKYISEIMLVVGLGGKAGGDFAMQRLLEISAVNLTSHLACEKFCIGILPLANEPSRSSALHQAKSISFYMKDRDFVIIDNEQFAYDGHNSCGAMMERANNQACSLMRMWVRPARPHIYANWIPHSHVH